VIEPGILRGKRVLVTGGSGFVGSHIVDLLLDEGVDEVVVIDNMVRGRPENLAHAIASKRVSLVIGDVPAKSDTTISFNLPRQTTQESAPGYEKPFEIEWAANTIVAMRPSEGQIALY